MSCRKRRIDDNGLRIRSDRADGFLQETETGHTLSGLS